LRATLHSPAEDDTLQESRPPPGHAICDRLAVPTTDGPTRQPPARQPTGQDHPYRRKSHARAGDL